MLVAELGALPEDFLHLSVILPAVAYYYEGAQDARGCGPRRTLHLSQYILAMDMSTGT